MYHFILKTSDSQYYIVKRIVGIFKVTLDLRGHLHWSITLNTEVPAAAKWKPSSFIYKKKMANITYQAFYKRAPAGLNSLFIRPFHIFFLSLKK